MKFPILDKHLIGKDTFIIFYLKTSEDASIILFPGEDPTTHQRSYEIILRAKENSQSEIRFKNSTMAKSFTPYLLSNEEWRPFWIRITPDRLVQVGKEFGTPPFLSWKDKKAMNINHFGFCSYDDIPLQWAFRCQERNGREKFMFYLKAFAEFQ